MNTEFKDMDVVTLYKNIDGVKYVYLTTDEDEPKFKIRKVQMAGNIEMYVGLDSDSEFDKAMLYFTKNHKEDIK